MRCWQVSMVFWTGIIATMTSADVPEPQNADDGLAMVQKLVWAHNNTQSAAEVPEKCKKPLWMALTQAGTLGAKYTLLQNRTYGCGNTSRYKQNPKLRGGCIRGVLGFIADTSAFVSSLMGMAKQCFDRLERSCWVTFHLAVEALPIFQGLRYVLYTNVCKDVLVNDQIYSLTFTRGIETADAIMKSLTYAKFDIRSMKDNIQKKCDGCKLPKCGDCALWVTSTFSSLMKAVASILRSVSVWQDMLHPATMCPMMITNFVGVVSGYYSKIGSYAQLLRCAGRFQPLHEGRPFRCGGV